MVYVTNEAKQALIRLCNESHSRGDTCLRLTDLGHDAIGIDTSGRHEDDDQSEDMNGIHLFLDHHLAGSSSGISLDAYETPEGPRLIISKEVIQKAHATVTVSWVTLPSAVALDMPPSATITQ